MTGFAFELIRHTIETSEHFPPAVPERFSETKVARTFVATGGDLVHTQYVGYERKRRRRFLIERVEITWTRRSGDHDWRLRFVTARGATVLASGEVSKQSTGYQAWWSHEDMPEEVAMLLATNDTQLRAA